MPLARKLVQYQKITKRFNSLKSKLPLDASKLTPEEQRAEAAKLAMQSLKDMGRLFSSSPHDNEQPIDTKPVWENPGIFGTLPLIHQGQVLEELQQKFDKSWKKLTLADKKLGYYIAYGNWGSREQFSNWKTLEPPFDLPFETPSKLQSTNPSPNTIIHELPKVVLAETPIRKPQFDTKRIDGPTKFFIYLTLFICIGAFYRDKKIGEEGKPQEQIIIDRYTIEKERKQLELEAEAQKSFEEEKQKNSRKWYYLWLK